MGKHDSKHDASKDNRPPARSGPDLCREFGHGKHKKNNVSVRLPNGQWAEGWKCERCHQEEAYE